MSAITGEGISDLIALLQRQVRIPVRDASGPFLFSVDHCFPIKGKGTVLTGTVLSGSVSLNQVVEFPELHLTRKVKSMQMFHQPLSKASTGDRVGILVTQFDADQVERGILADPGTVPTFDRAIVCADKIKFYKGDIQRRIKYHISIGHVTAMANAEFFTSVLGSTADGPSDNEASGDGFDWNRDYLYEDQLMPVSPAMPPKHQWALLTFDSPITTPVDSVVIGARLDFDVQSPNCRLAFSGRIVHSFLSAGTDASNGGLCQLRVFKWKQRQGSIDRVQDACSVIGKGLFKKETDISLFVGLKVDVCLGGSHDSTDKGDHGDGDASLVTAETVHAGVIEGSFGKSGKFKVRVATGGLPVATSASSKKKTATDADDDAGKPRGKIVLRFKRYVFGPNAMAQ